MNPVPKQWIRGPADVEAIKQGCYFDPESAERPIEFIESLCKQSIGDSKGDPLYLFDWQKDFLRRLFGWKQRNGRRRYKRVYLEVAKKNGKSTLLAALQLYLLLADGEGSPEIRILACDKSQAGIIFKESAKMINASPALKKRLKLIGGIEGGNNDQSIVWEAGNGVILVESSVVESKDGVNPSVVIFDELHRQPGRALWDIFEFAQVARQQPLRIAITTAGEDESGVWHEERTHADAVNSGKKDPSDIHFLGIVYRAMPEDNIDDPATWKKANPSMGETFTEDAFALDLARSKENPFKLNNFKRLRLGIICKEASKFIDAGKWSLGSKPIAKAHVLKFLPCYGGADLSSIVDLTATVFLHGTFADGFDVTCHAYLPEENIVELERRDRVPYRAWAEKGYLTLTPGSAIDYEFVRADINRVARENGINLLLVDPHNAQQLCNQLIEQDGLNVRTIQQGSISLNAPTKELLRLVMNGKIRHGDHPILKWCILNAIASTDAAGNIKLDKRKSREKIDLAAALVNAIAAAQADDDSGGESVYESRGVLFL